MADCPKCGASEAYEGFKEVECVNSGCELYNPKWHEEVVLARQKRCIPLDYDDLPDTPAMGGGYTTVVFDSRFGKASWRWNETRRTFEEVSAPPLTGTGCQRASSRRAWFFAVAGPCGGLHSKEISEEALILDGCMPAAIQQSTPVKTGLAAWLPDPCPCGAQADYFSKFCPRCTERASNLDAPLA